MKFDGIASRLNLRNSCSGGRSLPQAALRTQGRQISVDEANRGQNHEAELRTMIRGIIFILHSAFCILHLNVSRTISAFADRVFAPGPCADFLDGAAAGRGGGRSIWSCANEDLDARRFRLEFVDAMIEDLRWFGFRWQEGPDCGGPFGPYAQSERRDFYRAALEKLRRQLHLSVPMFARDVLRALQAPHAGERGTGLSGNLPAGGGNDFQGVETKGVNWRFRVPDGEPISFVDGFFGPQQFQARRDFGDFVVWRHDDVPAYQLSVVVDDAAMKITEVVRGADLLISTARQLLLYRALGLDASGLLSLPAGDGPGGRAAGQEARRAESEATACRRPDAGDAAAGLAGGV